MTYSIWGNDSKEGGGCKFRATVEYIDPDSPSLDNLYTKKRSFHNDCGTLHFISE